MGTRDLDAWCGVHALPRHGFVNITDRCRDADRIEKVKKCESLQEDELKTLCEYVSAWIGFKQWIGQVLEQSRYKYVCSAVRR